MTTEPHGESYEMPMSDEERGAKEREHAKANGAANGKANGVHTDGPSFVFCADVMAELPERKYLSVGLGMAPGAPIGFFSYAWGGKSVILQDLVLSVVTGEPIWGQFSTGSGPVVHIDHEQGEVETRDRYQRLARARGLSREQIGDRIRLASLPSIYLPTPGAEEAYKRALDGCALGYVDSLAAAQPGVQENETQFAENLYMLGRVSEAVGAPIIVAGHTGKADLGADKPGDGRALPRGTSAIVAACGAAFGVSGGKGKPKLITQIKGRSLGLPSVEDFYLELGTVRIDGYENPAWPTDPGGFTVIYRKVEDIDSAIADDRTAAKASQVEAKRQAKVEAYERGKHMVLAAFLEAGAAGIAKPDDLAPKLGLVRGIVRAAVAELKKAGAIVTIGTNPKDTRTIATRYG